MVPSCYTVKTSIRPNHLGISVLRTHLTTDNLVLGVHWTGGEKAQTSSPTFWMQPSWDDTSASVSICCKTIWKGVVSFQQNAVLKLQRVIHRASRASVL